MYGKLIITAFIVLSVAWHVHGAVNCTAAGRFADPADSTCKNYTLCVLVTANTSFIGYNYVCPTTSLFNPTTAKCTTTYSCNGTTTNSTTSNSTSSSVCSADGFVADPSSTNCSSYIQCVLINGTYLETTLTCPTGSFYNPNTTLCEVNYVCAFTCTAAGRFANTADTTCQTYYLCVLTSTSTFTRYEYTCPTTSVFSPTTSVCTTTYTCPTASG
ncbi:PREDICTED: probable endochitinase [Papilio polytes]|uniref:probable endochitinase n=1 Tax=Papilio polytes TaxID=76194 RepID=UPI000675CAF0|nr:PREDICTED: probable endochitinase [Papilio polytes]